MAFSASPLAPLSTPLSVSLRLPLLLQLRALLLTLVWSACAAVPVLAQVPYFFSVNDLTIVSVTSPSCVNVYPAALNCSLPALLTVNTTGVRLVNPLGGGQGVDVRLLLSGGDSATQLYGYTAEGWSPSLIWATLQLDGFAQSAMGRLLSLTVYDPTSGNSSAPFVGLSIAPVPPPRLHSISGCHGDGASPNLGCVPDADVLTLTGSSLLSLNDFQSLQMTISDPSGRTATVDFMQGQRGVQLRVLNESMALLSLAQAYPRLLRLEQFGGGVQMLGFDTDWWSVPQRHLVSYSTNRVPLSFAALRPPSIMSTVAGPRCITAGGYFVNCSPATRISFRGHYLIGLTVMLEAAGKQPQPCADVSIVVWQCLLPIIANDTDGLAWDVVVSNPAGSQRLPGLVTYSTKPSIAFVEPCNTYGLYESDININCQPGQALTVRGMRFPDDPELAVVIRGSTIVQRPLNVTCPQLVRVDSTMLTCVVPSLDGMAQSALYSALVDVLVVFNGSGPPALPVQVQGRMVADPQSPLVQRVSGCESNNGSHALLRCRGGDVLVVEGAYLLHKFVFVAPRLDQWRCRVLPNSSNERLLVELPFLLPEEKGVLADTPYVVHYEATENRFQVWYGRPFTVTWTWDDAPAQPSAPSADDGRHALSSGALALVVLLPLLSVVLLVVCATVLGLRWKRDRMSGMDTGQWEDSGAASERAGGEHGWTGQPPVYTTAWQVRDAVEMQ